MKTSLQPICPSQEGTAKSHKRRGMDCAAGGAKFGHVLLQGTELLPLLCRDWFYCG